MYNEVVYYAFMAFGMGATAYAIFKDSPKSQLKKNGIKAEGIVFTQDRNFKFFRLLNCNNVNDAITVRFVTDKEEWITGEIEQPFQIFYTWQYQNGKKLKLFYDKNNPSSFYAITNQSELIGRVSLAIIGLSFAAIGAYNTFFV